MIYLNRIQRLSGIFDRRHNPSGMYIRRSEISWSYPVRYCQKIHNGGENVFGTVSYTQIYSTASAHEI